MDCLFCRDNGKVGGCPKCGKELNLIGRNSIDKINTSTITEFKIPKHYASNPWNALILKQDKSMYCDDPAFNNYVDQLTKCYEIFQSGKLPKVSALVSSPMGYGKTTCFYNCLIEAVRHAYDIVPIIDTSNLRRLLTISSERPEWSNTYLGYSLESYLNSDILIVSVTQGPEYIYAYETIINILDIRSKRDKATIVLSNYTINELSGYDKRQYLKCLLQGGINVDPFRYLVPIEFIPYK